MPLTDPIGEPLIEELESLIPGLAPTKPALLPGIKTSKPFLYQTPGESENSEQPNLIETASQPKDEFSPAKADALIINKASVLNSIPSAQTSDPKTNSYSRDATTFEIDPLIGKLDSDLGDPLTNPNRIISPVVTTSTTSEKAAPKTPLPATAETSSKPEDQKTSLPSEAILKSDLEPNKTAPATVLPTDKLEPNKTVPATVSPTDKLEPNKTVPATVLPTDKLEPNKTVPVTVSPTDKLEPNKTVPVTVSPTDKLEPNKTVPVTVSPTDKLEPNKTVPVTVSPTDKLEPNKTAPATVSPTDKLEPNKTAPATVSPTDKLEPNKTAPATVSPTDKLEPNKTAPATVSTIIPERSTNSSEESDKIAVTNSTQTVAASPNIPSTDKTSTDKQSPVTKADDKIDSEKKSPTVDAIATEKPTSNSQQPTTQPATAPLIRATSNPVSPDVNIREEVKSTDLKNPVQTATQSLTDKQNDTGKLDPLKTEPAATPKTAASENVAVTTATAAVKTPEKTPNNTDSLSEIKQPVKTESIVSLSADAELIKTDTTVTASISKPPAETESIIAPIAENSPAKTDLLSSNVGEQSPKETNSNVSTAAEQLSTKNESIITAEINSGTVVLDIPVAEITGELETEQLPTKTDLLKPAEFTADTIERDIVVSFTAAELETEKTLPVAVNSLEPEPLISNSNYSVKTEQRTGDFQSNTNSPTNLSITAAANSPSGTFLVDNQGKVKFDYQFDGGYFQGEVGIFSLAGMSALIPGTPEFIAEASRRVLSNSTLGNVVISDSKEGAKFTGAMPFDGDWGSGEYQGIKTFSMLPGDTFAVMLVPNATIQSSFQSSYSGNLFPENRPLFSIATANPNDTAHLLQIADITGSGNTFALEDMSPPNSDRDYNDLIFKISGATGNAPLLDTVINPDREWRNTPLGQQLLAEANPPNSDNNPPVVSPTSARTYTELETTISLDNLATDVEGDPLTISVLNPVNGTVIFNPLTNKASFKPATGFSGIASFDFLASDAFGSSTPARVTVNVSDVPLLNLDFVKRNPRLNAGENTELVAIGDFADQKGVVLPDSYLTYTSINPEIAPIDPTGKVTGLTNGTSILSASRKNLQAVTPIRVGTMPAAPTTDAQLHQILAELYGLDPYPDAVSLSVGASRKLSLSLNSNFTEANLTAASTGTRYFSNNSNILNVSPDGTITAVGIGDGTVTAIHGAASATIPVRVEAPKIGTTALGTEGGIINSSDGTLALMIPPGALKQNATVSIAPVNQQNLSLPLPPGFEFAGAFNLNFSDNSLNIPAQLAVPAPAGLAPGTVAYFLRKGAIPDATGTWNPIWLQEESGIVGDDGNIRTQSPPYPGVVRPGEYAVVYSSPTGSATLVKGQLTLNYNFPLAFFGIIDPLGNIGQLIDPDKFVTTPAFTVTRDISSVQVVAIPKVGLPVVTEVGVQRNDDGTATFKAALNMPAPTSSDPTTPPVLQKAELKFKDENNQQFENNEPLLFLTGGNILVNNASDSRGSKFEDLTVKFYAGNSVYEGTVVSTRSRSLGGNQYEVAVKVPDTVVLGASGVVVERKQNQIVEQKGATPVYKEIQYHSNPIRLPQGAEYVFAALGGSDRVAVLNGKSPESVVNTTNSKDLLLAQIPVGTRACFQTRCILENRRSQPLNAHEPRRLK